MRENSATVPTHPALNHRCPFCHADPGQTCRTHRGRGVKTDLHTRRIALVDDWVRQRQDRRRQSEQALCCVCGALRTFKRVRNHLAEWGDKQNWHRMTGDLKCVECGTSTRHAILRSGDHRDSAEEFSRIALGGGPTDMTDASRLQAEYRMGLPRNPYLHHRYWVAEARRAWAAGERQIVAVCGEQMELDYNPDGPEQDKRERLHGLLEPSEVRADQEYEDPDTGLWWIEMDCVDCLRIANNARREQQLKDNRKEILRLLDTVPASDWTLEESQMVRALLEAIATTRSAEGQ